MASFYLAIYPAGAATPTWNRANIGTNSGWSGSPVYTDADTDPGTGSTYQFTPDASGLSASTSYDAYAVWDDGTNTSNVVSALGWSTTAAGITGTLTVSETGIDALTVSGTVALTGALTVTEVGVDSSSMSGGVLVSGGLSAAETGADTANISGSNASTGSLTAAEVGNDTAALSGTVLVAGTLAASEVGADSASSSGQLLVAGTLSATETGADTFTALGGNFVVGSLSASESGADSISVPGVVLVSGGLTASESGTDSFAAPGFVKVTGTVSASESGADTFQALAGSYSLTYAQAQLLSQIYLLHGLGSPLSVAPTSRTVAGLEQQVVSAGGEVTITTLAQDDSIAQSVGVMVEELAALHGITQPLVVTSTSRAAGAILQLFSSAGSTTTITRQ